MSGAIGWVEKHSLGLFLLGLALVLGIGSAVAGAHKWEVYGIDVNDFLDNRSAEATGAFLVTVASKWFREEGSPSSKEPTEE